MCGLEVCFGGVWFGVCCLGGVRFFVVWEVRGLEVCGLCVCVIWECGFWRCGSGCYYPPSLLGGAAFPPPSCGGAAFIPLLWVVLPAFLILWEWFFEKGTETTNLEECDRSG